MVETRSGRRHEVRPWGARGIWGRITGAVSPGAGERVRDGSGKSGGISAKAHDPVGLHVAGGVAVITLRRPDKLNAINAEMWETVTRLVQSLSKDENARVLILNGEGENFSAGSDLKELGSADLKRVEEIFHRAEECAAALEESPLPTIACINGYALGTGLLMALACDMRVASAGATLGMPIARLGITLSKPFTQRLVALTGPSRMKDLVYTGRLVDAEEAHRLGIVDRLMPAEKSVLRETLGISKVICQQSSASIRAAKRWGGSGSGRAPAAYGYVDPDEFREGVQAFLERRPPRFYDTGNGLKAKQPSERVARTEESETPVED